MARKVYYFDMDGVLCDFHKEPYNYANAINREWIANLDPFTEAIATVKKMFAFTLFASVLVGVSIFIASKPILMFYNTSQESKDLAEFFMKTVAIITPINAFAHASYFTLRSGGKTFVTFLFDSVFLLGFVVPFAFALYYLGNLSIFIIFPVVQCTDIIKDIVGFTLIKKKVWVNNIVD